VPNRSIQKGRSRSEIESRKSRTKENLMRGPTGYRVVGSLKWGDSEATPSFLPKEYIPQKKEIWLIGSE